MHATPEAAAMDGFPAEHCRVLAVDVDGDDAFVMLDTGPADYLYLYGGTVFRDSDGWHSGGDSNGVGIGWRRTVADTGLGVVHASGEAPLGADAVRIAWRGTEREGAIRNGIYLMTWWREPYDEAPGPCVLGFRIDGKWTPAPRPAWRMR
jgi:hypothetical protein